MVLGEMVSFSLVLLRLRTTSMKANLRTINRMGRENYSWLKKRWSIRAYLLKGCLKIAKEYTFVKNTSIKEGLRKEKKMGRGL